MQKHKRRHLTIDFSPGPTERLVSFVFCCVLLALSDLQKHTILARNAANRDVNMMLKPCLSPGTMDNSVAQCLPCR